MGEPKALCILMNITDLLKRKQFITVEQLKLSGSVDNPCTVSFPLHTFGRQMPNVKSLSLDDITIGTVSRKTDHIVEPSFTSSMCELSIRTFREICEGEDLYQLSSFISGNSSLRLLNLACYRASASS